MKYQCANCEKIFDEKGIIITGINTGWGFFTSTIFCNDCYELYKKSKKSCYECKYWGNPTKFLCLTEPCKSCRGHNKFEL